MTVEKKRALGRGLDALLPAVSAPVTASGQSYGARSVFMCPVEALHPQRGQPRQRIDEERLEELAASIREHGLIEPIVVRRLGSADQFEIVAGERRWRASQRAGLREIMVVVKDVSSDTAFELALIENLQREDLDSIEIAEALERLIKEHGYTHETLARRLHKDRSTVSNALRLLKLPPQVRSMVVEGRLSEGHARALLGAPDTASIELLADKAVRGGLSVRKVEAAVRQLRKPNGAGGPTANDAPEPQKTANVRDLEQRLSRAAGMRAELREKGGKGEVVFHYATLDELDRLLEVLGLT